MVASAEHWVGTDEGTANGPWPPPVIAVLDRPMKPVTVRPTFLLLTVALVVAVLLFSVGWLVVGVTRNQGLALWLLLGMWIVGVELNFLPWIIDRWASKKASQGGGPFCSLWIVDV